MIDKPQVNIFALCEHVVRDRGGKPSLLGVFDVINFKSFPATFQFNLFAQINAMRGDYRFAVHVYLYQEGSLLRKLFEDILRVDDDPGAAHVSAAIPLTLNEPGLYEFRLYIDDVPALTRPFHVRRAA